MEYHELVLPDQAAWDAFGWVPEELDPSIQRGPQGQTAKAFQNYFIHDDGTYEMRAEYLVNIAGPLEAGMAQYELTVKPTNPKSVFQGA